MAAPTQFTTVVPPTGWQIPRLSTTYPGQNVYTPPIPQPAENLKNLAACVAALKACVESLSGQRGDAANRAVLFKDLVAYGILDPSAVQSKNGQFVGGGTGKPSGGTVTSITAGVGLTGGTITGAGTIALAVPVSIALGGTNAATAAQALANLGGLPLAGGVMTGPLTLAGDPASNLQPVTLQYLNAQLPGAGAVVISDSAPASPHAGELWFDSIGLQTYVYYNDPNSSQWVPVAANPLAGSYLPLTGGTLSGALTVTVTQTGVADLAPITIVTPVSSDNFLRLNGNHQWGVGVKGTVGAGDFVLVDYSASGGVTTRLTIDTSGNLTNGGNINIGGGFYCNNRNVTVGQIQAAQNDVGTVPAHGPSGHLGLNYSFIPQSTTRILVIVKGSITYDTVNMTGTVALRYGTGTAPVRGAAATGTQVTSAQCTNGNFAGEQIPTTLLAIITGLTIGTQYWFDVYQAINSGNGDFFDIGYTFLEV